MMPRSSRGLITLLVVPSIVAAQPRLPSDGGIVRSLGQPSVWLGSVGISTGVQNGRTGPEATAEGRVGVYHELLNRALGLGGVQLEAYGGTRDTRPNGGVRVRLVSPLLRVGIGTDYNIVDRRMRPVVSFVHPGRRGGLFGDGSTIRIDYRSGPFRALSLGVETPVGRHIPLGATRPRHDRVRMRGSRALADPLPTGRPGVVTALAEARAAARRIQRLTVPWVDHKGGGGPGSDRGVLARLDTIRMLAESTTVETETRRFHAAVTQAFSDAVAPDGAPPGPAGSAVGRAVAAGARAVLLDEVLLPYNRLLGQEKRPDGIGDFGIVARGAFLRWLYVRSFLSRTVADSSLAVFSQLLDIVEENRAAAHAEWAKSRFVWLPLQYALLPEEHDEQGELDALVAKATREPFTEGNQLTYIINEQFQYHLHRSIRAARQYHVLWTHDFRGYDDTGNPDEMSFRHVLRSYYSALIERARAYDSTGVFPTYLIILDQWFYQNRGGRLWMTLLEDPLHHQVHLPSGFAAWEDSLRVARDSLRAAIDGSLLLTAQRRQFGETWLRKLVKVHVNITNASDPSFWSWRVATAFPVPDNWMRDHRKLVVYDVSEEDAFRGEAIITGAGIGEHYSNLSWEDRSVLLRGPAALAVKTAARELLEGQGIRGNRLPAVLRPVPFPRDYGSRVADAAQDGGSGLGAGRPLRAALLQNRTGFDAKSINVARAVLYTLMPPGSVIKVPDSLWNGTFWGAALIGCALRGGRVLVIAPTLANAPARAFGSMIRSREMLWRLIMAERLLAVPLAREHGLLKVGLYDSELPVSDVPRKILAVERTLTATPWLRDLFAFPPEVYTGLANLAGTLGRLPAPKRDSVEFEARQRPLLHLKATFIASREAWTVMARPDWVELTRRFVPQRMGELSSGSAVVASFAEPPAPRVDFGQAELSGWYKGLTPEARDRVVFYTMLGSANQNDRSMVSDGEAVLVMANWPSVIAYIDLISLIGQSRWVDDPKVLDALLPPRGDVLTRIAHWFKYVF